MLGPVQVLVVGVADDAAAANVVDSMNGLAADGPVRLIDAFTVEVTADGELEIDDAAAPVSLSLFADEPDSASAAAAEDGGWTLFDAIPPGSRAVVALLEHRWAIPLRASLEASGAALHHETWLSPEDRDQLAALISPES